MKQTAANTSHNEELLALVPRNSRRLVEIGCGGGGLAREYKKVNAACEYIGIELEPQHAEIARPHCDHVIVCDIEDMHDDAFASLFPSDCWIFGDVLEHLHDPWAVLRRLRTRLPPEGTVLACIPNAQHWSVQALLNAGEFRYQDSGLLDRTHIRWFTKSTLVELFQTTGFDIVEGGARLVDAPEESWRERALAGVRAMAEAIGGDVEAAVANAIPFQWIIRAIPRQTAQDRECSKS
jgi:2-polyprenyl-3-methyl-5-hydroxy-6-metoxy-1,4-benzoquinol methylase